MRCSNLLEPCGSHHDDARVLKCETSLSLTELWNGVGDAFVGTLSWLGVERCLEDDVIVRLAGELRDRFSAAVRRVTGSWSKADTRMDAMAQRGCFEKLYAFQMFKSF